MALSGSSSSSTSPTYSTLQNQPRYQSYLRLRDALQGDAPVNEKLLANKVANLNDLIQARGSLRYLKGAKGDAIRREIEEARALRNELLRERNRRGIEPEEPAPPPLPVSQQPVRTPFGTFQPGNTPYQQIERGRGNIGSSARRNIAALEKTQAAPTEIHLTSTPLAGPGLSPIEKAESFVGGINAMYEGRQVLIATRQGDTYSVQYNPALSTSGYVDELAAERLTALGFSERDGKFSYTEPSYDVIYEDTGFGEAKGNFDFSEPYTPISPAIEKEAKAQAEFFDFSQGVDEDLGLGLDSDYEKRFQPGIFDFSKEPAPLEFYEGKPVVNLGKVTAKERAAISSAVDEGRLAFLVDDVTLSRIDENAEAIRYRLGSDDEKFFSAQDNPVREFFSADYSKGVKEFVRDILTPKEQKITTRIGRDGEIVSRIPIPEKDRREFGGGLFSEGVGFLGESTENYLVKPIVGTAVVGRGTVATVFAGFKGDRDTALREAGDVYAAFPDFIRAPYAATTIAFGGGQGTKEVGRASGQAASQGAKLISTRVEGTILEKTFRTSGGFTFNLSRNLGRGFFANAARGVTTISSPVIEGVGAITSPVVKVAAEGAKYAAFGGGAQAALEFGLGAVQEFPQIVPGKFISAKQELSVDGQVITVRDPLQAANPASFFVMQAEAAAPQALLPASPRFSGKPSEDISEFRAVARRSGFIPATDFRQGESGYARLTPPTRQQETQRLFGYEGVGIFNPVPLAGGGYETLGRMFRGGIERLQSPQAQERIKASVAGFGLLGMGIGAAKQGGPVISGFLSSKLQSYKQIGSEFGFAVRQAPQTFSREAGIFLSSSYFLANAPKQPPLKMTPITSRFGAPKEYRGTDSIGFNLAEAATERGLNPFSPVKPTFQRIKSELAPREFGFSFIPARTEAASRTLSPQASPELQKAIRSGISRDFRNQFIGEGGFERKNAMSSILRRRVPRSEAKAFEAPGETVSEATAPGIRQLKQDVKLEALERAIASERGRLKVEQVALIRQRGAQGQRFRQRQNEDLLLGQTEFTGLRTPELELIRLPLRLRPPPEKPPPPTLIIPGLKLGQTTEKSARKAERDLYKLPKARYAPSLAGIDLGLTATRTKGVFSGAEVRGLIRPKARRRKRR